MYCISKIHTLQVCVQCTKNCFLIFNNYLFKRKQCPQCLIYCFPVKVIDTSHNPFSF